MDRTTSTPKRSSKMSGLGHHHNKDENTNTAKAVKSPTKKKRPSGSTEESPKRAKNSPAKSRSVKAATVCREPNKSVCREIPDGPSDSLNGLTFVVTGEFLEFDRKGVEQYIHSKGGRTTTALSGKTDYLLTGTDPGPQKLEKIKTLGTHVISLDDMFQMVCTRDGSQFEPLEQSKPHAKHSKTVPS